MTRFVVGDGDDLEGWRLSRLMRDADSSRQVNVAERQYSAWLQAARKRPGMYSFTAA
jgi:hypothetical protein